MPRTDHGDATKETDGWVITMYFFVTIFLVMGVVAFILVLILWTSSGSFQDAKMIRTNQASQKITADTPTPLNFDTELSANNITYSGSIFTVKKAGTYNISTNVSVNTTGTGGGGTTLGPVAIYALKINPASPILYGNNKSMPTSTTPAASGNSQLLTLNTNMYCLANEAFSIGVLAPTDQAINGGPTSLCSIVRVSD